MRRVLGILLLAVFLTLAACEENESAAPTEAATASMAPTPEEKPVFETLKANYPMLALYPTVHPAMRFHSAEEQTDFLAIGQKAAHFTNTDHFVNVVEGGGMIGFQAVTKTLEYLTDAHLHAKDMKSLVQMKGLGCACCL